MLLTYLDYTLLSDVSLAVLSANPFVLSTIKCIVNGVLAVDTKVISPVDPAVGEKYMVMSVCPVGKVRKVSPLPAQIRLTLVAIPGVPGSPQTNALRDLTLTLSVPDPAPPAREDASTTVSASPAASPVKTTSKDARLAPSESVLLIDSAIFILLATTY
jgi:hypothetical protein